MPCTHAHTHIISIYRRLYLLLLFHSNEILLGFVYACMRLCSLFFSYSMRFIDMVCVCVFVCCCVVLRSVENQNDCVIKKKFNQI